MLGCHSPAARALSGRQSFFGTTAQACHRRSEWQDIISRIYAPIDIEIGDAGLFVGQICNTTLARLSISEFRTQYEIARRDRSHIAKDSDDYFMLSLGGYGSSLLSQNGRECVLDADHCTLLYTGDPYVFTHTAPVSSLTVKLPAAALRWRIPDPHALCAVATPIASGVLRIVADLILLAIDPSRQIPGDNLAVLEESLTDLIGIGFASRGPSPVRSGTSGRWAIQRRATSYMKENAHRLDLSPDSIAAAMGISVRYLHRVFEDTEHTAYETLTNLRLERSRESLVDGDKNPMSIKEIAIASGFKNQSHFSSLFRARFGATPREFRQAPQSGSR